MAHDKDYIDLTEENRREGQTDQHRRRRSITLEADNDVVICTEQFERQASLETPRANRKRRLSANEEPSTPTKKARSPTPCFRSENVDDLTPPPTPKTPRHLKSRQEFEDFQIRRRRETEAANIAALRSFESRRIDQLEWMRFHEPLSEVKRRTLEYPEELWDSLDKIEHNNLRIVGGGRTNVQLKDGTFLRVFAILRNIADGEIRLKGLKFYSIGYFNPLLPRAQDELCLFQEIHQNSHENPWDEGMVDVRIEFAVKERVIRLTNRRAPPRDASKLPDVEGDAEGLRLMSEGGTLRCRWKLQRIVHDDTVKNQRRVVELVAARLRCEEADEEYAIKDSELFEAFRKSRQVPERQYSMADFFCGAGGASAGAMEAGLRIVRAVDSDEHSWLTYTTNFGEVCLNMDIAKYCLRNGELFVDVAHCSPPCQFLSRMNNHTSTTLGFQNNERNRAALFCLHPLLLKDRPRIATMENTSGLYQDHPEDMWPMLGQFTALGYSIRFGVLNMADFGVPATRKRFILVGSCPGEKLPSFPAQTHTQLPVSARLPRWVGAGEAIDRIPGWASHHEPRRMPQIQSYRYDRTEPFHTIMTTRDAKPHYSGTRRLTFRELATIQGFPYSHDFPRELPETKIVKQIGNAVPVSFMKLLFEEAIKTLRETDRPGGVEDGRSREIAFEIS